MLVFLRGATNPPPKGWLFEAEPWNPKRAEIDAAVPDGAEQAIVLMVPDTGGVVGAVTAAVRGRPGAFVRAAQELNQAMLDRARLDAYLAQVREHGVTDSARLAEISPQLAQSLAVKLDSACLLRQRETQAACLTEGSNAVVLADSQTSSIAQTLAGAPADIALQLSATAQAGYGYYSPYIEVVRDLARILGAFQSAQLQFIPALGVQHGAATALLLNAVPSFHKPQSVLVAALPMVAAPSPPPLQARADGPICVNRPGLVLPVTGAPLVYATDYARQMALRIRTGDGRTLDIPVDADPAQGGYVLKAGHPLTTDDAAMEGVLHGLWGFAPFDGPRFRLSAPTSASWQVAEGGSLVIGRETPLLLEGGTAACITEVVIEQGSERQPVLWSAQGDHRLALKVPLATARAGPVTILVRSFGIDQPQRIELNAYAEASRISDFSFHAGDREGVLTGMRLDQVATLEIGGVTFRPQALGRVHSADQLVMSTDMAAVGTLQPGETRQAKLVLTDGRTIGLKVTIAAARPIAALVSKSVERIGSTPSVPIAIEGSDIVPQNARLVFSLKGQGGTRFSAGDKIEIATTDMAASTSLPLRLQDAQVAIAELEPGTMLGSAGYGALQFRVMHEGVAGEWQPLATVVRLPSLRTVTCADKHCVLSGEGLFLVRRVIAGGAPGEQVEIPDGFTGSSIDIPRPDTGRITLVLRDAPQAMATVTLPN